MTYTVVLVYVTLWNALCCRNDVYSSISLHQLEFDKKFPLENIDAHFQYGGHGFLYEVFFCA